MWNDTDIPLAYLITFRCRGTWRHGDARGSTDRFNNRYKSPYIAPNAEWLRHNTQTLKSHNTQTLKSAAAELSAAQRASVEAAIRATCELRRWSLYAISVRTNHVHVVAAIGETKAGNALNALKANATRQMRADACWRREGSPWADKGSVRYLWNERSIERAVEYVVDGQDGELPEFE